MSERDDALADKRATVHAGWGDKYVQRVHDKGKWTTWERIEALKDPALRKALDEGAHAEESGVFIFMAGWAGYTVDEVALAKNKSLEGRTIGDIAAERGVEPFDALLDLAIEEELKTSFIPLLYGDDDHSWQGRVAAWQDSRTVVGASDAGAHLDMIDTFALSTQVLGNGVRRHGVISLEEGVRQLTDVPARLYGLRDRGRLEEGMLADVVVFDPDQIQDHATFQEPHQFATGVEQVFVNGEAVMRDGELTGALPGRFVRGPGARP